jgi:homoserine O-acetyltransferase/O-succinyltransferase
VNASGRRSATVGRIETASVEVPPFELECGETLPEIRIAYEAYGELDEDRSNVILVFHAISGDAHAAGLSTEVDAPVAVDGIGAAERGIGPRSGIGWWDRLIGPGKAFDTDRYYVLCSNVLGGCRGSTGSSSIDPRTGRPYGSMFPVVTVADIVRAQRALLDELGIETLLSVAGGSLGGMQALEWALSYPDAVHSCVLSASTARLDTQGVALNAVARAAIMADPNWNGGDYYETAGPDAGLAVARMLGHITYLSKASLREKFGRELQSGDDYRYTLTEPEFSVESYLDYQGGRFVERFDANTYLVLSRALTYFDAARAHGAGSLAAAMAKARARFLLLSFSHDWIYPTADSLELLAALRANGVDARHAEVESAYGHDSFLLENDAQQEHIEPFLAETYARIRG